MHIKDKYTTYIHILLIAVAYFVLAKLGHLFTPAGLIASAVWPAAGFAIGVLFLYGRNLWVAIFVGEIAASYHGGIAFSPAVLAAFGVTATALLGAHTLAKFVRDPKSDQGFGAVFLGVMMAGIFAPLVAATIGSLTHALLGTLSWSQAKANWVLWWRGDFLGILLVLPWMMAFHAYQFPLKRVLKLSGLSLGIGLVAFMIVSKAHFQPALFLIFPVLLTAAILSKKIGIPLATMVTALVTVVMTSFKVGPFALGNPAQALVALQFFLGALGLTSLVLVCIEKVVSLIKIIPVLVVGWLFSGAIYYGHYMSGIKEEGQKWNLTTSRSTRAIKNKISFYEDAIYSAKAFLASKPNATSEEWRVFVENQNVRKRHPGIKGLGVVVPVKSAGELKYVIKYIEPLEGNENLVGRDMGMNPDHRKVLEKAMKTGAPVISKMTPIQNDPLGRKGFGLAMPFYNSKEPVIPQEKRSAMIRGWIFASFVGDVFFKEALKDLAQNAFLEVYEGEAADPAKKIFQSADVSEIDTEIRNQNVISLGQAPYTLVWKKEIGFLTGHDFSLAWLGSLGILLSLALTWMFVNAITVRQRTEKIVRAQTKVISEKEQIWRALMESAPVGFLQVDKFGHVTYVNPRWTEISGLELRDSIVGRWIQNIYPDDRSQIEKNWTSAIKSQKPFDMEFRLISKSNEVRWINVVSQPILNPNNHVTGYVVIVVDVTERVGHQQFLEQQRVRAIESAKLVSLGEMAGGISHEINNPLAIISLATHQVRRIIEKNESHDGIMETVDKIDKTVFRIAKIIKGLKAFSRNSENDPMTPCSLKSTIDDALELCSARFNSHAIEIIGNVPDYISINCRPGQVSQVVLNLLMNSYDAIHSQSNAWIRVDCEMRGSQVEISITDSGHGIPDEISYKIMNPFFTTKEVGRGTGLGLSISKGIIEEHGGTLSYDKTSKNTRFVITFPVVSFDQEDSLNQAS